MRWLRGHVRPRAALVDRLWFRPAIRLADARRWREHPRRVCRRPRPTCRRASACVFRGDADALSVRWRAHSVASRRRSHRGSWDATARSMKSVAAASDVAAENRIGRGPGPRREPCSPGRRWAGARVIIVYGARGTRRCSSPGDGRLLRRGAVDASCSSGAWSEAGAHEELVSDERSRPSSCTRPSSAAQGRGAGDLPVSTPGHCAGRGHQNIPLGTVFRRLHRKRGRGPPRRRAKSWAVAQTQGRGPAVSPSRPSARKQDARDAQDPLQAEAKARRPRATARSSDAGIASARARADGQPAVGALPARWTRRRTRPPPRSGTSRRTARRDRPVEERLVSPRDGRRRRCCASLRRQLGLRWLATPESMPCARRGARRRRWRGHAGRIELRRCSGGSAARARPGGERCSVAAAAGGVWLSAAKCPALLLASRPSPCSVANGAALLGHADLREGHEDLRLRGRRGLDPAVRTTDPVLEHGVDPFRCRPRPIRRSFRPKRCRAPSRCSTRRWDGRAFLHEVGVDLRAGRRSAPCLIAGFLAAREPTCSSPVAMVIPSPSAKASPGGVDALDEHRGRWPPKPALPHVLEQLAVKARRLAERVGRVVGPDPQFWTARTGLIVPTRGGGEQGGRSGAGTKSIGAKSDDAWPFEGLPPSRLRALSRGRPPRYSALSRRSASSTPPWITAYIAWPRTSLKCSRRLRASRAVTAEHRLLQRGRVLWRRRQLVQGG